MPAGDWIRTGGGIISGMGNPTPSQTDDPNFYRSGGGGGKMANGMSPQDFVNWGQTISPYSSLYTDMQPGIINAENYLGRMSQPGHGSGSGWEDAFNLRRRQQAIQNSPGMQGFWGAVNNPTPLESVGRQGVSFQGMGAQGNALQNQLALLLGKKP